MEEKSRVMRGLIKELEKNETLKELIIGILFMSIIFQSSIVWFVEDKIGYSVGLWLGTAVAVFMAWHMWKTIDEVLDLSVGGAQKVMRKNSLLRYLVVTLALVALMITKMANPLAAFLGIMTLKVAAYLQPFTHKVISKLRR